jgi:hypothetical protein
MKNSDLNCTDLGPSTQQIAQCNCNSFHNFLCFKCSNVRCGLKVMYHYIESIRSILAITFFGSSSFPKDTAIIKFPPH